MSSPELLPFSGEHLDAAGELLAARHRRHRAAEPLLPARFEDAKAARAEIETAWRKDDAAGAVALQGGRIVGYLVGAPDDEAHWGGGNVWVGLAGHAGEDAEIARDLYAVAAERWVDAGRSRHYVMAPASERELLESWYRLSFGQQHAHGISEVRDEPWPESVRETEPRDVDGVLELAPLIRRQHAAAPVFSARRYVERSEEMRAVVEEEIADDEVGTLVAEVEGRIVGGFVVAPVERSGNVVHGHGSLARPERSCYLAWAATLPEARGSGAGVALTQASFAWARRAGYETMVTDWRVTNLLASRFWPRRGFRTTFLRLYRSIP
ncbi:MAG: GNAT family N-acetyltransferase [Actinobacteria bacterium]|nr:MAG: GNAT family N-acetyltransferase [Actinomycetota bacterium]